MIDFESLKKNPEVLDICEQIANIYRNKLKEANYDPNGELIKSTNGKFWDIKVDDTSFTLYFNLPNYWKYAEYGTGGNETPPSSKNRKPPLAPLHPGRKLPPVEVLEKWLIVKKGNNLVNTKGKPISTRQAAWAVAKSIQRYGTGGQHSLAETKQEIEKGLKQQLISIITQDIDKQVQTEIENEMNKIL